METGEVDSMASNMTNTYGVSGEKTGIQYVMTDSVSPIGTLNGDNEVIAGWHSIQYNRTDVSQIYAINGTFNMVDDGGNWKILV
jgi:hypothetical protein